MITANFSITTPGTELTAGTRRTQRRPVRAGTVMDMGGSEARSGIAWITLLAMLCTCVLPLGLGAAPAQRPAYGPYGPAYLSQTETSPARSETNADANTNAPARKTQPDIRAVAPTNNPQPSNARPTATEALRETAEEAPAAAPAVPESTNATAPVAPAVPSVPAVMPGDIVPGTGTETNSARRRRPPTEASRRLLPGAPPLKTIPPLPSGAYRPRPIKPTVDGATDTPPVAGRTNYYITNSLPRVVQPSATNTPAANPADLQMRPEEGRPSVPVVTSTNSVPSPGITPSGVPGRNVGPVAVPPRASAQQLELPPVPRDDGGTPVPLSLRQCVLLALKSNLDIGIERLSPEIARANVMTQRGAFDPRISASYTHGEDTSPFFASTATGEEIRQSTSRRDTYDVALSQRTSTGGVISANTSAGRSETAPSDRDDTFSSFAGMSIVQPLLRGFGTDVNLGPLRIARRNQRSTDAAFYNQVESVVRDVAVAYFELIYIRRDLETRVESLQLAEQLLRDNAARVEIGTMSPIDVSQASAQAATRREELYRVQRSIRDQENVLKRLITNDIMPWLNLRIIPTDVPPDNFKPSPLQTSITTAMRNRMDLRQSLEQAEIANIQVRLNENGMLPQVDFRADYGYGGLARQYGSSLGGIAQTDNPQWQVGVTVEIPLGNREARGRLMASDASRQQTLMALKRLEQNIIVEVDNASGRTLSNQQRILSARVARALAEETLNDEQIKLNEGASTSFVVLQLQQDLTAARLRELRAVADMQISVVDLVRVQGVIMQRNELFIDNAPPIRRGVAAQAVAPVPPLGKAVPVAEPLDPPKGKRGPKDKAVGPGNRQTGPAPADAPSFPSSATTTTTTEGTKRKATSRTTSHSRQ
ncbi:MAG: TolC family protein [Candidatus Methylacidiphilales bacterium]